MKTDTRSVAALERLVLACVREHPWDQPPAGAAELLPLVDQEELVALGEHHRVAVALALSLRDLPGLRPEIRQRLVAHERKAIFSQLLLEAELGRVAAVLGSVPWLVVKGPVLARDYYRYPSLRTYADLDVLVPPVHLEEAVARLERAGYVLLDRNWTLLAQRLSGELHLVSSTGTMIDLHWDLFNDRATRDSYAMVTGSFFERSRTVRIASTEVRTLDDLDTVVHTAVHAARSGGDRLVWMKDLEQLVLAQRFSWDELAVRCREHHAQLAVSVMLQRMQTTLGTAVLMDADYGNIGGPAVWRLLGRLVDTFSPVVRADAEGSMARMYARATRADARSTIAELGRRVAARARRRAHPNEATWDASSPESVLFESGGSAARAEFFTAVGSR